MTEFISLSSLEKVFLDYKKPKKEFLKMSVMKNERFSYQIAYIRKDDDNSAENIYFKVSVKSPLKKYITIRRVENVGAAFTHYPNECDDDYLKKKPGLYPDPLFELENSEITASVLYNSLWISVDTKGEVPPGTYNIDITFKSANQKCTKTFELEIKKSSLPEQDIMFTQWFHCDCIADAYDVKIFSKKHWDMIKSFAQTAVNNGINTILTPVLTPPLDTQIGGERPTVQLVDVIKNENSYTFGFEKFHKWVDIMHQCGVKYFEISHLFTQWGAKAAPKVVAKVNGKTKRIFGWDTASDSAEYKEFLDAFLPAFTNEIRKLKIENNCIFHVSDEPHGDEQLKSYMAAKNIVKKHLNGFKIMDALSSVDFYKAGAVENPIPSTNNIEPFLECGIKDLWTYYCCGQNKEVCNRFMDMPSYRNRAIALQLFKYNIKGFLQWGYNFYYSMHSKRKINPFMTTDAGNFFPAGDAFSVYPGKKGAIESLRICVFYDALQDLRALKKLESFIGHEKTVEFVQSFFEMEITFKKYPKSADALLKFRDELNKKIDSFI